MSIFTPFEMFGKIVDITPEYLKENNIKTLLLDVDNTLSRHHEGILYKGVAEWLEKMQKNGIGLLIVSNSKNCRIEPFAKTVGLDFEALSLKPLPKGIKRGIKKIGADKKTTALVGDQIFTDVLGAKISGIKALFVRYIEAEKGRSFKIRRYFERKILKNRKYIGEEEA